MIELGIMSAKIERISQDLRTISADLLHGMALSKPIGMIHAKNALINNEKELEKLTKDFTNSINTYWDKIDVLARRVKYMQDLIKESIK